jgi:hypothetical protein
MWRFGLDLLSDEHLEPARRPGQRVAFGHGASVVRA